MNTPSFDKIHSKFKFNGIKHSLNELKEVSYSLIKEGEPYEKIIGNFLLDWLDEKEYVTIQTSGATGTPKMIQLSKKAMVNSSIATGDYLKLKPGNTALHCLPSNYVAGKMMLVRAMILGLEMDLVEPTSQPIFDYDKVYDFAAMLPMQFQSTLTYLHNVKIIIVGGSSVSQHLTELSKTIQSKVYATYGMTETATHIALKALNNDRKNPYFKVLPKVSISQDDRGCLVIDAPKISSELIVTNDIVKLHSNTEFEWLGRIDNVINSGGVKLFPEQIEEKLKGKIPHQFFIASESDELLGERLILVLESETNHLDTSLFGSLEKFEIPKNIYYVPKFKMTPTGKIKRAETLKMIK